LSDKVRALYRIRRGTVKTVMTAATSMNLVMIMIMMIGTGGGLL
jgi:hypothetical protein